MEGGVKRGEEGTRGHVHAMGRGRIRPVATNESLEGTGCIHWRGYWQGRSDCDAKDFC